MIKKEKVINHLTVIKKDFCLMLKEKMGLTVTRMHIKHKTDNGLTDVIKFTVCIENENKFIYAYVNRQDKKTINICTDISIDFLNDFSKSLLGNDAEQILSDFDDRFLAFTSKYSLFEKTQSKEHSLFKPKCGIIRSHSTHSYFYAKQDYSIHFLNKKLYKDHYNLFFLSTKIMIVYENNTFISYPCMYVKFGSMEDTVSLYSFQKMRTDLSGFFYKMKYAIEPSVKSNFKRIFDIDEEAFDSLTKTLLDDHLTLIAMHHI